MFPTTGPEAPLALLSAGSAESSAALSRPDSLASQAERVLAFYVGSEKMNPVPLFLLGKLGDGIVGGLLTALVHT